MYDGLPVLTIIAYSYNCLKLYMKLFEKHTELLFTYFKGMQNFYAYIKHTNNVVSATNASPY